MKDVDILKELSEVEVKWVLLVFLECQLRKDSSCTILAFACLSYWYMSENDIKKFNQFSFILEPIYVIVCLIYHLYYCLTTKLFAVPAFLHCFLYIILIVKSKVKDNKRQLGQVEFFMHLFVSRLTHEYSYYFFSFQECKILLNESL